jgi:hypothetical protein
MPQAKTEEDVQRDPFKKPPIPFNQKKEKKSFKRGSSFTDDQADGGGWVKQVDKDSGRTYWFNRKTMETRWDKPTAGSGASGAASRKTEKDRSSSKPEPGRPRAKTAEDVHPPGTVPADDGEDGSPEAKAVKEDLKRQLQNTMAEPIASRKKTFKFLCLQWHPDKNPEKLELATEVFQYIQQQRDWYLKE